MEFYAFIPREDGSAPLGSANKVLLRDYKTVKGAISGGIRRLGSKAIAVFSYSNFYDDATFRVVFNNTIHKSLKP